MGMEISVESLEDMCDLMYNNTIPKHKKQDAIEEDYQFLNKSEEITEDDFED